MKLNLRTIVLGLCAATLFFGDARASERVALPGVVVVEAGSSLQAVADNATAVTYTIFGAEIASSVETPKRLGSPGYVTTSPALILSPTVTSVVTMLVLNNTTGGTVTGIKLFHGGSATVNQMLGGLDLCAHCTATLSEDGWRVISDKGELLSLGGAGGGGGSTYFAGTCLSMTGTTINFAPGADCSLNNHKLTSVGDGVLPTDGATFGQLSAAIDGRQDKDASNWCTTGDISLSGLGTQANGEWTSSLAGTERVLVRGQSAPAANGIYTPMSGAWARTTDANIAAEVTKGATTLVTGGATCSNKGYTQNSVITTLGADPQTWVLTSSIPTAYTGDGTSVTLTSTQFSRSAIVGDIGCPAGSATCTLPNVATPGTSTKITYNAKGQVTSGAAAQLASSDFANQGTLNGVLHGNNAGPPAFGPIANADMAATMPNGNRLCRKTAGTGSPEYCTATEETALLDPATSSLKGLLSAADKAKLDSFAGKPSLNASGGAPVASCRGNTVTGTAAAFVCGMTIPANSAAVGQMYVLSVDLQQTAGTTATFTPSCKAGNAGTTADTTVATVSAGAAGATNLRTHVECIVYIAATGASATVGGEIHRWNPAAAMGGSTVAEVLANANTASTWYVTMTGLFSAVATTYTVRGAAGYGLP